LSDEVSALTSRSNLDKALRLVHDFVERIITEPLCTSLVFGSKTLDDLCQRIGLASLAQIKHADPAGEHGKPVHVYIVTKLQKSGGHTRVIEDFIKAQPGGRHVILSTELAGKSDGGSLSNAVASHADVSFEMSPRANYHKRLTWLQRRMLQLAPQKVYLFNHHQDSVAVAAIQPEMNLEAAFYHHGDHHLCLGLYLPHLKHIDLHPMGYHTCREGLGIENIYIPLTLEDRGARSADLEFLNGGRLTTCTAARSNKVEIPYFVSYLDLVPKLLKTTGGRHIHIGRLTPWARHRIRRGLKRHGVDSGRFVYIEWVPSVWRALQEHGVDLYVASFPYGGGLTLIEAMGAGIPVVVHCHIFSRVLSGVDLAYPDAFRWRQPAELLNYCASVTRDQLKVGGSAARTQFEQFHSSEHLDGLLNDSNQAGLIPNPLSGFTVETDEWALWMEQQLNLRRLISRAAYRAFRRFRAKWL
jgi:hypothetical protein